MAEAEDSGVMSLTVTLLSAYFANNTVPSGELPALVEGTRRALLGGAQVQFVATTSWGIKNACLRLFRAEIAEEAANELWRQNPAMSARVTFSRGQKLGGALAAVLCAQARLSSGGALPGTFDSQLLDVAVVDDGCRVPLASP